MGVNITRQCSLDKALSAFTQVLHIAVGLFRLENHASAYQDLCVCT
jgi:hypothetical protein